MGAKSGRPFVIAALRLPPFIGSPHPEALPLTDIIDFALRNVTRAHEAGVDAICLQDIGCYPVSQNQADIHLSIANMTAIGCEIRTKFPDIVLGINTISPGATQSLAIANAIGAKFVRIKVYSGVVSRSEGIVEGCAFEALEIREKIKASNDILIFADIHDRDSSPIGNKKIEATIFDAVVLSRADGIILTGSSIEETVNMLDAAKILGLNVPIFVGGGININNINLIRHIANGLFISKSLWNTPDKGNKTRMWADWDSSHIKSLMKTIEI